jgi:cell fate regulator YaaT (PSP1 superfamily)
MAKIVCVCFKQAGKIYHFDPGDLELKCGDNVIVETARGPEFGFVRGCVRDIPSGDVVAPLKKVLRVAAEKDVQRYDDNQKKKEKAMLQCREKIKKRKLDMKLIDVEYTFDNTKIIFYFTADGRVDFRELVKDLASVFKMRIELRQIGVRDEAKMLGGIGVCGRALCCHAWLPDFEPVSIKMAKTQNLSLNPTKISGACGRLMCCLKYENDTYQALKKGMPDTGDRITTKDGVAVVMDANILMGRVKARSVLEERTSAAPEKLSTEICVYKKDDIKRIAGRRKKRQSEDAPEAPAPPETKEVRPS